MKAFIQSDAIKAVVGDRVSYNHVPQDKDKPYIFFQQSGADDDIALDDSAGVPNRPQFAIEAYADTPSEAVELKNLVHARLHKHRGAFGDTTVKGIFCANVDDNYEPAGGGSDDGLHWSAFLAEVVL